jgi:adenine/guanine phosphoribosyltransferase-like PRPP-binding protein
MSEDLPTRTPWQPNFPDVILHTDVTTRDSDPDYHAGKSGDPDAALLLARRLLKDEATAAVGRLIGERHAILLPVVADETTGFNAIPDAMAQILGRMLGVPILSGEIVQINNVGHTRAPAFQRIVTPAIFDGPVEANVNYVLVDDHVGLGGTLANLRGYVELRGGHVIGITTLTESRDARRISLRADTLSVLSAGHGEELDTFWKAQFGHGIDCLTEIEAQILCRQPSLATIQSFLDKAAIEASSRGLRPKTAR